MIFLPKSSSDESAVTNPHLDRILLKFLDYSTSLYGLKDFFSERLDGSFYRGVAERRRGVAPRKREILCESLRISASVR
jgi:hypothetical protein